MSGELVATGIVTVCCGSHRASDCCDPEDCGPCCEDCPTCPTVARWRLETIRQDTLNAFDVTEEQIKALDPDGSYERAVQGARAEREFFRDVVVLYQIRKAEKMWNARLPDGLRVEFQ